MKRSICAAGLLAWRGRGRQVFLLLSAVCGAGIALPSTAPQGCASWHDGYPGIRPPISPTTGRISRGDCISLRLRLRGSAGAVDGTFTHGADAVGTGGACGGAEERSGLQASTFRSGLTEDVAAMQRLRGGAGGAMEDSEGGQEAGREALLEGVALPVPRGGVVSWGINIHGRLGNGGWMDSYRPRWSLLEHGVAQVAVGDYHTLTLSPGGCVSGFGSNARGQLGDGTTVHRASPVTAVDLDGGIVKVAAGGYHSLALSWEGDLLAWGDNSSAQLGKPANEFDDEALVLDQGYPLQVHQPIFVAGAETSNGGGVQDMAAGFLHNLALLRDGRLLGWGNNVFGQLGNGKNFSFYFGPEYTENEHNEYTGEAAPMRVRLPGARPPALSALAAGGWHSAAVLEQTGGLLTWGNNHFGQLGDGRFTCEETPGGGLQDALVPSPCLLRSDVASVSLGFYHSLAILRNGTLLAWGSNQAGQLGVPDDSPGMRVHSHSEISFCPTPRALDFSSEGGLVRVTSASAGFAHSACVLEDGRVFVWGANYDGQLGRGFKIGDQIQWPTGKIRGDWRPRAVEGFGPRPGRAPAFSVGVGSSHTIALLQAPPPTAARQEDASMESQESHPAGSVGVPGSSPSVGDPGSAAGELFFEGGEAKPAEGVSATAAANPGGVGEGGEEQGEWGDRGLEWSVKDWEVPEGEHPDVVPPLALSFENSPHVDDGGTAIDAENITDAMRARAARQGFDVGPYEIEPTTEEHMFPLDRVMFHRDSNPYVQRLPSIRQVWVQDELLPRLNLSQVEWRNITEEEAEEFQMPYPQQYRDGYGTANPPKESVQKLLDDSRAIYARHNGDAIQPRSQEESALCKDLESLICDFELQECYRTAALAEDDFNKSLARGNFAQARVWARKTRRALKLAGHETEGQAKCEMLLKSVNEAEKAAAKKARDEYIAEEERDDPDGRVFNRTTLEWERPSLMHAPIDKDTIEHIPSGHIRLELLYGENVHQLEAWLQKSLGDPGAVITTRENGGPVKMEAGAKGPDLSTPKWLEEGGLRDPTDTVLDVASEGWNAFQRKGGEASGVLRVESVNPRFGGTEGEQVVLIRGYGFSSSASWQVSFDRTDAPDEESAGDDARMRDSGEEGEVGGAGGGARIPDERGSLFDHSGGSSKVDTPQKWLGSGEASLVDAEWVTHRVLAFRAPEGGGGGGGEGRVTVRLFRNGKEVWDLPGGYEYFDAKHRSIIALSITLRYRGMAPLEKPLTPKEKAKEAKIDEFHDDVCRQQIAWIEKFGFRNHSAEAAGCADQLQESHLRLLALDPEREESLHNLAIFFEDIRGDWESAAAAWRRYDPSENVTALELRQMNVQADAMVVKKTPEEEHYEQALNDYIDEELPEEMRETARLAPHLIRWPWTNVTEDIPQGRYSWQDHMCSNSSCTKPRAFDPEAHWIAMRGCCNIPVPDLG